MRALLVCSPSAGNDGPSQDELLTMFRREGIDPSCCVISEEGLIPMPGNSDLSLITDNVGKDRFSIPAIGQNFLALVLQMRFGNRPMLLSRSAVTVP